MILTKNKKLSFKFYLYFYCIRGSKGSLNVYAFGRLLWHVFLLKCEKPRFERIKKSGGQVMCVIGMQSEQASLVQALLDLHDKTQSLLLLTELVEYST